jgi:hypothetical protein
MYLPIIKKEKKHFNFFIKFWIKGLKSSKKGTHFFEKLLKYYMVKYRYE